MQLNAFETGGSSPPLSPDLVILTPGIATVSPLTPAARTWLTENVHAFVPAPRWLFGALIVDPRHVAQIVRRATAVGLRVRAEACAR